MTLSQITLLKDAAEETMREDASIPLIAEMKETEDLLQDNAKTERDLGPEMKETLAMIVKGNKTSVDWRKETGTIEDPGKENHIDTKMIVREITKGLVTRTTATVTTADLGQGHHEIDHLKNFVKLAKKEEL